MALRGNFREGAGGNGVAPLTLDEGPSLNFTTASTFGCGVTTNGRAIAACSARIGVVHAVTQIPAPEQLRLATVSADGRSRTQESGPFGRGIWFEAKGNDRYAIGQRGGRFIIVKHWGTPLSDVQIADAAGTNRALATAVLNGQFSAGIDLSGRLIVMGGALILSIARDGTMRKLNWSPTSNARPRSLLRRLIFPEKGRMLIVSAVVAGRPRIRRAAIASLSLKSTSITADRAWGSNGIWTAPPGFAPADLLMHPDGSFVCVGWMTVAGGVALTAIRIAEDGLSDTPFIQPVGAVPQPYPFETCIDSDGGLLVAFTGPHPLSVFLAGLPEMGWVSHWLSDGQFDTSFGIQGVCWAQHLGYPIAVRGLAATNNGFFLACDRPASIDRQFTNTIPVVFAFDNNGRSMAGFGETGIVHHDEVPASFQIHEASGTVAVGVRTVWGATNTFELAVSTVRTDGSVMWRYGTPHGFQSAPLFLPDGTRAAFFWISALSRWGPYLAIGVTVLNPAPVKSFVTIRNADGTPLPQGVNAIVELPSSAVSLEPLPNGALEVTYRTNGQQEKQRLLHTPIFTKDGNPTPAVIPPTGISLPDGSTIHSRVVLDAFSHEVSCWIYRELPGGSVDPNFGGRSATAPHISGVVTSSGLGRIEAAEVLGFFAMPNGDYFLAVLLSQFDQFQNFKPVPIALFAAAWRSSDGAPAWPTPKFFGDTRLTRVNQVLPDPPDGVLLVGGSDAFGQAKQATIKRLLATNGAPDPAFANGGTFNVRLRGVETENQAAFPIVDRADGTKVVPVTIVGPDGDDPLDQRLQLLLAWLDVV